MSREKLTTIKKYINNILAKGFVTTSIVDIHSLILLVKKPRGGLGFYVNY